MIHLDTHVVLWLYTEQTERIPAGARDRIEVDQVVISPMVRLELTYLHEIGRLTDTSDAVIDALSAALELRDSTAPFASVIRHAMSMTWTRDPFDRVITAHALADGATLLTADETIRAHLATARWE